MYMNSPAIEEKLKKADCHLDELLDEDEIIQEMKNQNSKLLNLYFIFKIISFDKKNVKQLLDYIISEPQSDDHKRGHKYPFIASEILNCDVSKINEFFTATDSELSAKERKCSSISNNDSDMVLSQEDHLHGFSNFAQEDKLKSKNEQVDFVEENAQDKDFTKAETEQLKEQTKDSPAISDEDMNANKDQNDVVVISSPEQTQLHNKSISDLINVENLEDNSRVHQELTDKQKNKIELLDYLFSFLETDEELNYVLVGYFSKFLNLLLNRFPHKIIAYIYNERPDILDRIIRHSNKKSISEIVPKVLLVESYINNDKERPMTSISIEKSNNSNAFANLNSPLNLNAESVLATRKIVLINLFKRLSVLDEDIEKTSNVANILIEVIENKSILEIILGEKAILEHLTSLLSIDLNEKVDESNFEINYNYNEVLNVFINILRYALVENLKFPTYKNEGTEDIVNSENGNAIIENTHLGECVLGSLEKILKNFLFPKDKNEENLEEDPKTGNYQIEGTFGNLYKPLSSKRVKLVELVYYLLNYFKNVQSVLDRILISSQFLKYLVEYFFKYEWNNLYQLNFENFLKSYLNNINNHPDITKHLFDELKLLNLLMEHGVPCNQNSNDSTGFTFNSSRKINHGYFSILIEICSKISQIESLNPIFKNNHSTPEWETFVKEKVIFWRKMFERKLCLPEAPHSTSIDDFTHMTGHNEETHKDDVKNEDNNEVEGDGQKYEDINPFQRDEYFYNMGNENEDWFNSKKTDENFTSDMLEDINSFEFVEDRNYVKRKFSQEETLLKEKE
jgi:hypothetical protein